MILVMIGDATTDVLKEVRISTNVVYFFSPALIEAHGKILFK
jgi:hypothetical protein